MAQVAIATIAAPGTANEDYVAAGPDWWVVLDGVTPAPGAATGCAHSVRWLVRQLAAAVGGLLARDAGGDLTELAAEAIDSVRAAHGGRCDLDNPDSPSSTLAVCRYADDVIDCLVLADSPILVGCGDGRLTVVEDTRPQDVPAAPGGDTNARLRYWRNRPGGFWVASTSPKAALQAVTRQFPASSVSAVAMLTDGATRLADHYGMSWAVVFPDLISRGPRWLIEQTRTAERTRPPSHGKKHDDATALVVVR
jgi:hypothetical protein